MRAAWLALLLLLAGCRYSYLREGSDRFLQAKEVELVAGVTTARQLAEAFGPPQLVKNRGGDLIFYYRFRESDIYSVTVRYFGGQWLQGRLETRADLSLIAVFGPDDRLRYLAPSSNATGRFPVTPQPAGAAGSEEVE